MIQLFRFVVKKYFHSNYYMIPKIDDVNPKIDSYL
jgi:hypothetical protein